MMRRSVPASKRCVANECLNRCGYTSFVIFARFAAALQLPVLWLLLVCHFFGKEKAVHHG